MLRLVEGTQTEIVLSEEAQIATDRLERFHFEVPHYDVYKGDKSHWGFLRLLQVNPDIFLYNMEGWFDVEFYKTLSQTTEEDRIDIISKVEVFLSTLTEKQKHELMARIQVCIPKYIEIQNKYWTPEWDGFTPSMIQQLPFDQTK